MRYLISILGLAIVVGAGYFAVAQYANVAHGQSSLLTVNQNSVGASADGAEVLALLNKLQSIKLNGKIFADPNFIALQDWSVSIAPQTTGRQNPYLQSYGAVPAASSSTKVPLPQAVK